MCYKVGIDIIHLDRIKRAIEQNNPIYFERMFGKDEMREALSHPQPEYFYASRFAAKEAVLKSFGVTWEAEIDWAKIQIIHDSTGMLTALFSGPFRDAASQVGMRSVSVSISYDTDYVTAVAIMMFD